MARITILDYAKLLKEMAKAKSAQELEKVKAVLEATEPNDPLLPTLLKYYNDYSTQFKTGQIAV